MGNVTSTLYSRNGDCDRYGIWSQCTVYMSMTLIITTISKEDSRTYRTFVGARAIGSDDKQVAHG